MEGVAAVMSGSFFQRGDHLIVIRKSRHAVGMDYDVAGKPAERGFKHVQPAAHHADDEQNHERAKGDGRQGNPGNSAP